MLLGVCLQVIANCRIISKERNLERQTGSVESNEDSRSLLLKHGIQTCKYVSVYKIVQNQSPATYQWNSS